MICASDYINDQSKVVMKMLTIRGFQLLTKLLESSEPLRLKDLSEQFKVSTRTIKYDLDDVKSWLNKQNIDVQSQPNKGIWVECNQSRRSEMLHALPQIERDNVYLDQSARVRRMIMMMLATNEYITASNFAERMRVSRNTTLNDMNQMDELLHPWEITLERKHRAGYKLLGDELSLRLLFEHLLHVDLTNHEIYNIMSRITKKGIADGEPMLIAEILPVYKMVEKQTANVLASAHLLLPQSDLLRMLFRSTISVIRLNNGITMDGYRLLSKENADNFTVNLIEKVYASLQLPIFEGEYLYISGEIDNHLNQIDLVKVTKEIINFVSEKQGINYHKDPKLYSNLFAHLSLRFQKGEINFTEVNPFTDELKRDYLPLFESIKQACETYLSPQKITVPDSFVSLIVLHFIVSFERTFNQRGKIRTLYVCATGRGVARLIKNRVEREIIDIDIVKNCSIMEVDEICKREEVDLIISVFPIETEIPLVIVDPLPSKRDLETIRDKVSVLLRNKNLQFNSLLESGERPVPNEDADTLSQEIILKGFEINQEIQMAFADEIEESKKQALMLHIFLMVHRCYFEKQYDNYLYANDLSLEENKQLYIHRIKSILASYDLPIHEAEVIALLQYIK